MVRSLENQLESYSKRYPFMEQFSNQWRIGKRVFGTKYMDWKITVPNGGNTYGLSRELVLSFLKVGYKNKVNSQVHRILNWFSKRKYFNDNLKNDLFFGCGQMLFNQFDWFNLIPQAIDFLESQKEEYKIVKDNKILRLFTKLITSFDGDDEKWRIQIKKKLESIRSEFFEESTASIPIKLSVVSKTLYGQRILPFKKSRVKYPKSNLMIAKYLVEQIMRTPECQTTAHRLMNNKPPTNYKKASEILRSLSNLFGVNLPTNLNARI